MMRMMAGQLDFRDSGMMVQMLLTARLWLWSDWSPRDMLMKRDRLSVQGLGIEAG